MRHHEGSTEHFAPGDSIQEPPTGILPWIELVPQCSYQSRAMSGPTAGRTMVEFTPSILPFWRTAQPADFSTMARAVGASFPKAEAVKLQKIESSLAEIISEVDRLSAPGYIETKRSAVIGTKLSAREHCEALVTIESEGAAIKNIVERLLAEAYQLVDQQLRPAAKQIIDLMLKHTVSAIEERVRDEQQKASSLGLPVPRAYTVLRTDPLPSLCALGSQLEGIADEINDAASRWRVRNLLSEAGVIQLKTRATQGRI